MFQLPVKMQSQFSSCSILPLVARLIMLLAGIREQESGTRKDKRICLNELKKTARLQLFSVMNKLKKTALRVIAEHLFVEEVADIKGMFSKLDINNTGKITSEELTSGLHKLGHQIPDPDVQILMDMLLMLMEMRH